MKTWKDQKGAILILSERKNLILLSQNWFRFRNRWLGNYFKQEMGKKQYTAWAEPNIKMILTGKLQKY